MLLWMVAWIYNPRLYRYMMYFERFPVFCNGCGTVRGAFLLDSMPLLPTSRAARRILHQLCKAIAFMHAKGVVYRDIKPENMLVSDDEELRLCDFGFARRLDITDEPCGGYVRCRDPKLTDYGECNRCSRPHSRPASCCSPRQAPCPLGGYLSQRHSSSATRPIGGESVLATSILWLDPGGGRGRSARVEYVP